MGCEMCRGREGEFPDTEKLPYQSNPKQTFNYGGSATPHVQRNAILKEIDSSIYSGNHQGCNDKDTLKSNETSTLKILSSLPNEKNTKYVLIDKERKGDDSSDDSESEVNRTNLNSSLLSKQNFNDATETVLPNTVEMHNTNRNSNCNTNTKMQNQYISMSSIGIQGGLATIPSQNTNALSTIIEEVNPQKAHQLLTQCTLLFYFEIYFFKLWNAEYLRGVYPEGKLFYCIKIDEDESTYEKIPLIKSTDKKEKDNYIPVISDVSFPFLRIIKPILHSSLFKRPHKITNELCILTKGKMGTITQDEFYLYISNENSGTKIQFYGNSNTGYTNKKIGNSYMSIMFYIDTIEHGTLSEKKYNEYLNMFTNTNNKLMTYNEESMTQLIYYNITNTSMYSNSKAKAFSEDNFKTFDTSKTGCDIPKGLREGNPTITLLLGLLKNADLTKYDMFEILKRGNRFMTKKEFDEEKVYMYQEVLFAGGNCYGNNVDLWDKITLPYLFHTLRKVFFKKTKKGKIVEYNITSPHFKRYLELIFLGFKSSFNFIDAYNDNVVENKQSPGIHIEIPGSAMTYIAKNIEDSFPIPGGSGDKGALNDGLLPYIFKSGKYQSLLKFLGNANLLKSENVLPAGLIINSLGKYKFGNEDSEKHNGMELTNLLAQDKFKQALRKILDEHSCNSGIMNCMFCVFKNISETIPAKEIGEVIPIQKSKEIMGNFKPNFEILHENMIFLIKTILKHNSELLSKGVVQENYFTARHYEEIINIFVIAVQLLKNKLANSSDLIQLTNNGYNIFMNIYTCCSIINNINESNQILVMKACIQSKYGDGLIDSISTINDKGALCQIDYMLNKSEIPSIATKTMMFRLMYHCGVLVNNGYKIMNDALQLPSVKKGGNIFCVIEENDAIYSPKEIMKEIDERNIGLVNQVNGGNEYYIRYKGKVGEMKEMLKQKLIQSVRK